MNAVGECTQEGLNGLNLMTTNLAFGMIARKKSASYVENNKKIVLFSIFLLFK